MKLLRLAVLAALLSSCSSPFVHVPTNDRLLDPLTQRASPPLREFPKDRPLRVAVYGDSQGNHDAHRQVASAIRNANVDLVIFTGDALNCLPTGHLPDFGGASYFIPWWPQQQRGKPAFMFLSLLPFPALLHELVAAPFAPPRDPEGFNGFLEETADLRMLDRVPFLFIPGNHDLYHDFDRHEVARLFGAPGGAGGRDPNALWHSVDTGPFRFIVLDAGNDVWGDVVPLAEGGEQIVWLEATLADAASKGLRPIVSVHFPPFSSCREDHPPAPLVRGLVERVLDRHGVRLVLSGHAHAYERIQRAGFEGKLVTYLVSGGGGGPFHHAMDAPRCEEGSKSCIQEVRHFVLLEMTADKVNGWMIPVNADGIGPAMDEFEVQLR